jgi:hypothetical protein
MCLLVTGTISLLGGGCSCGSSLLGFCSTPGTRSLMVAAAPGFATERLINSL